MYGGVEAGGTKFVCVIGTGPDDIVATTRLEVTGPAETVRAAIDVLPGRDRLGDPARRDRDRLLRTGRAASRASPVRIDHDDAQAGVVAIRPWSSPFAAAFGVPVGFDTDVNAAALAEGRWGAGRGLTSFVYLTLGTGIGGGAVVDGRIMHGLGHLEIGHLAVSRHPSDAFAGVCPFHRDCLEGMASGPAIAARFGQRGEDLEGAERIAAAELVGFYVGAGIRSIIYALAPERIVIGGGLSALPGLAAAARAELDRQLGGYPGLPEHAEPSFISARPPGWACRPGRVADPGGAGDRDPDPGRRQAARTGA